MIELVSTYTAKYLAYVQLPLAFRAGMSATRCERLHRAFGTRDIVEEIIGQIAADIKYLSAVARVNKLWADIATRWLWQAPPRAALVRIIDDGRRVYYDEKVRHITVDANYYGPALAATFASLQGWRLQHLQRLTFDAPSWAGIGAAAALLLQRVLEEQQPFGRLCSLEWDDSAGGRDEEMALCAILAILMVAQFGQSLAQSGGAPCVAEGAPELNIRRCKW
jgi:hypothetical protein